MRFQIVLALCLLFAGCKDDELRISQLEGDERIILEKLGSLYSRKSTHYWEGYDLSKIPQYIVVDNRGYLINVDRGESLPVGSVTLDGYETFGLEVVRNDVLLSQTPILEDVGGGLVFGGYRHNSVFYFRWLHSNEPGPNPYFNWMMRDNNWVPLLSTHELFHVFQSRENWDRGNQKFNIDEYPLTKELLALHSCLWELAEKAYEHNQEAEVQIFLKEYIALKTEMKKLDPSIDHLITTMGDNQELFEGSARYVEHFSAADTYYSSISSNPTHGWSEILNNDPTKSTIREAFSHRIGYHVGAIITKILRTKQIDVAHSYKLGDTPYILVKQYLQMTDEEIAAVMNNIRNRTEWETHLQRAENFYYVLTH